jgi:hypothetical protein
MRALMAGLLVIGLAGVAGCGGGDGGPTGPSNSSIAGTWHLSLSNVSGSGETCSAVSITLVLQGSGSSFSGTYDGVLACGPTGGQAQGSRVQGSIVNGTRSGSQVAFDMDNSDLHHTGTISGDQMSGTANYHLNLTGGLLILSGSWTATR